MISTVDVRRVLALGGLCLAFLLVYGGILLELATEWGQDENYSHGYLVIPAALYLAWTRRADLERLPRRPSAVGALVVAAGLGLLLVGTAGIEYFLTRVSLIGVLAGAVVFLFGWAHLRVLAFPLAFLFLMIPLPAIVFNQIAFPLQLLATRFGVAGLQLLEIPVLREGNVIVLATTTLEVAEACSGIRSLISLLAVASLYAHFAPGGSVARTVIALSAIPTAILTNGLRVAGTGVAAHYYGAATAEGFFHTFSGWIVFLSALAILIGVERVVRIVSASAVVGLRRSSTWQVGHSS